MAAKSPKAKQHRYMKIREWQKANPHKKVQYKRKETLAKYGLTLAQYHLMYEQQDGRCAICFIAHSVLCVDHCHKTMRVRALLCQACNKVLGFSRDSPLVLQAAIHYLGNYL